MPIKKWVRNNSFLRSFFYSFPILNNSVADIADNPAKSDEILERKIPQ